MGRKRAVNAGLIVARVMQQYNLQPEDISEEAQCEFDETMIVDGSIDDSKRFFLEKAQAGFACISRADGKTICRQWSSYHASAVIDLFEQTVILVGKQGCRMCDTENNVAEWKIPHFGKKAIEEMAKRAVERCLVKIGRLAECSPRGGHQLHGRPAHDELHCRLCKLKGKRCC